MGKGFPGKGEAGRGPSMRRLSVLSICPRPEACRSAAEFRLRRPGARFQWRHMQIWLRALSFTFLLLRESRVVGRLTEGWRAVEPQVSAMGRKRGRVAAGRRPRHAATPICPTAAH